MTHLTPEQVVIVAGLIDRLQHHLDNTMLTWYLEKQKMITHKDFNNILDFIKEQQEN